MKTTSRQTQAFTNALSATVAQMLGNKIQKDQIEKNKQIMDENLKRQLELQTEKNRGMIESSQNYAGAKSKVGDDMVTTARIYASAPKGSSGSGSIDQKKKLVQDKVNSDLMDEYQKNLKDFSDRNAGNYNDKSAVYLDAYNKALKKNRNLLQEAGLSDFYESANQFLSTPNTAKDVSGLNQNIASDNQNLAKLSNEVWLPEDEDVKLGILERKNADDVLRKNQGQYKGGIPVFGWGKQWEGILESDNMTLGKEKKRGTAIKNYLKKVVSW